MAHVNILSLPIEVIQLIGNDGQYRNCLSLKTLRLVCSQFNRAFEAQVLSTLVIAVIFNNLKQSLDMLWTFASQNKKSSRAVLLARTLKIKFLSPRMNIDPVLFPIPKHEPENQDLLPSPPSLIRRLASTISSLKQRFKRELTSKEISAIGEERMKEYLELAISSMKNLENVRWAVQMYDPSWTEAAVIRGLARLPQLQDLQLTLNRDSPFESSVGQIQLDRLSGLKKISLSGNCVHVGRPRDIFSGLAGLITKSPQLVHLEVKVGCYGIFSETPTLHDLLSKVPEDHPLQLTHLALNRTGICIDSFTLPHLRSLISLDLRNLPVPSNLKDGANFSSEVLKRACSTSDICAILKQEGIYLKNLVVSDVGVFDYLCSYSGLETLDLCSMSFNSVEESNSSASTFYKSVLPQLVHSLQVLKVQPKREGRWCFNPEDVFQSVALSQCNKLRSLTVSLNSTFVQFYFMNQVLRRYKDNLDDVISSLINLSLSLSTLNEICIVIPKLAFESCVFIVNDSGVCYDTIVMRLVTRSINAFSLQVGHDAPQFPPDIWVDGKKLYQFYQRLEDGEGQILRYIQTHHNNLKLFDPYQYTEDNTSIIATSLAAW